MSSLYSRISDLCKSKGVSVTEMCRSSGASRGSLTDLKNGRISGLNIGTLEKISAYFGVSIDYLNCGEEQEKPAPSGDGLTAEEKAILDWYRTQASEKDKAVIQAIINS